MKMEDLKKLVKIIELAQSRGAYNLEESATILQVIREAETKILQVIREAETKINTETIENNIEYDVDNLTLTELREQFPEISARSKADFIEKLNKNK